MKIILWLLFFIIIISDQITKSVVRNTLLVGETIKIIGSFFQITHLENTGIAFGLLQGMNNILIFINTIIIISLSLIFIKQPIFNQNKLSKIAIILIISGAISNLIDRIVIGKITDFLYFGIKGYYWPAFNLADSCITIGGILLALSLLKVKKKTELNIG
jgi:signal peptidase II